MSGAGAAHGFLRDTKDRHYVGAVHHDFRKLVLRRLLTFGAMLIFTRCQR